MVGAPTGKGPRAPRGTNGDAIRYQRYNGETGAYFPKPRAPRCGDYRTVIMNECSMLTEELRSVPEGIDPGWDYNPGCVTTSAPATSGASSRARLRRLPLQAVERFANSHRWPL